MFSKDENKKEENMNFSPYNPFELQYYFAISVPGNSFGTHAPTLNLNSKLSSGDSIEAARSRQNGQKRLDLN